MDPKATLEIPLLGRNARLGTMYDRLEDNPVKHKQVWANAQVKYFTKVVEKGKQHIQILESDSFERRMEALKLDEIMQTNFICNFFQAEGAAADYLKLRESCVFKPRVTLHYTFNTKHVYLKTDCLPQLKVIDLHAHFSGTHVVTDIHYGYQAFFAYTIDVPEGGDHIKGKALLERMVQKVADCVTPSDIVLAEDEEKETSRINCTLYMDSHKVTMFTFSQALRFFCGMPSFLSKTSGVDVPLKAELRSIKTIDPYKEILHRPLPQGLSTKINLFLSGLRSVEERCTGVTRQLHGWEYLPLKRHLEDFWEHVMMYQNDLINKIAPVIQRVRLGTSKEDSLADVIRNIDEPPFSLDALNIWLQQREVFVDLLRTCFSKYVPNLTLDIAKRGKVHGYRVCFAIPIAETTDKYVASLKAFLSKGTREYQLKKDHIPNMKHLKTSAKRFAEFAASNQDSKTIEFVVVTHGLGEQVGPYLLENENSKSSTFEPPAPPSNPEVNITTKGHLQLSWTTTVMDETSWFEGYRIHYSHGTAQLGGEHKCEHWESLGTVKGSKMCIKSLDPGKSYTFCISGVCRNNIGKTACTVVTHTSRDSYIASNTATKEEQPDQEIGASSDPCGFADKTSMASGTGRKIAHGDAAIGEPVIYKVDLIPGATSDTCMYKTFHVGKCRTQTGDHRVVMVVGESGVGKSTLINGMINHIIGVKWEENRRFKIVSDQALSKGSHDGTHLPISYTIPSSMGKDFPYTVTLVDTPGFGDSGDITDNKFKMKCIEEFLLSSESHGIRHLDAVALVVRASAARLTPTQRYIHDSILSLFGRDMVGNILLLVTFADGQKPPVLDSVKEVGICRNENIFKFNHSALFARNKATSDTRREQEGNIDDNSEEDGFCEDIEKFFWRMNKRNMRKLFSAVQNLTPKTLVHRGNLIRERRSLEYDADKLLHMIQTACEDLDENTRKKTKLFQQLSAEESVINTSANSGQDMVCKICKTVCLRNSNSERLRKTFPMYDICSTCPRKCHRRHHEHRTQHEKGRSFECQHLREKEKIGKALDDVDLEFEEIKSNLLSLIKKSFVANKRLKQMLNLSDKYTPRDHMRFLIQSEELNKYIGWKARVEALELLQDDVITYIDGHEV